MSPDKQTPLGGRKREVAEGVGGSCQSGGGDGGMKRARYWRQEFGGDIVKLHCHGGQLVQDPDTFRGRTGLCSISRLVWIKIDANNFACAVGDCFWCLHCISQAYYHPQVDHGNSGQSASAVHVWHGGNLFRQSRVCDFEHSWSIEHIIRGPAAELYFQ